MTITNGYTTSALLKANGVLGLSSASASTYDDLVDSAINAASRSIDLHCGRSFFSASAVSDLYFTPEMPDLIFVDDISTATGLVIATDYDGDGTYENAFAATDYVLEPVNSLAHGWPATMIRIAPFGSYSFPRVVKGVKITATWGWPAIPDPVAHACLILAERLYKRPQTPLGVEGVTPFGATTLKVPPVDPDVAELLRQYVRVV